MQLINTSRWRRLRAIHLSEHPWCQRCLEKWNIYISANCVHHIVPVESTHNHEAMEQLCYSSTNLMSLCSKCHHDIHNEEGYHTKTKQATLKTDRAMAAWQRLCGDEHLTASTIGSPLRVPATNPGDEF